ncbi:Putative glycosyltransferase EpsE [Polaribacter huanghezhanensis]|uniref:glycosyltransferase n=1 Tax=Polaribacter huanghezhanensis TaxID=1354726 RepID=UPI002648703F|nr:glycosyltransferase [Polaribacter huanghezhanensis]WKD86502.1 Putative glycosyltransferase EpsE [Polaribacter huanghezhanensis]
MHKVSIILPSYNHAKFLKDRLDSIINQTYTNWKLIIIDDCSTDESLTFLNEFKKKHLDKIEKYIINNQNTGSGYNSWEKGIELANTEYIWVAETDDYSNPKFLEEQIILLEKNPTAALSFCASNYVDANKQFLYNTNNRTKDLNVLEDNYKAFVGDVFLDKMPFNTYITNGSCVVFRKPKTKIPKAIFTNKQSSDIFLWTYLLQKSSFVFLNKKLNFFRRHADSTTTRLSTLQQLDIFKEKIKYLHYFNIKNKENILIKKYFREYIWSNKRRIFNTKIFDFNLKVKYYLQLIPNIFSQLIKYNNG